MKQLLPYSEAELLHGLNEGDLAIFQYIYSSYAAELIAFARRNISSKEDCEEIVQEVFESLWARHESINIESLRFYLFRMVKNKIANYFRHKAVVHRYEQHFLLFEAVYDNLNEAEKSSEVPLQELVERTIQTLPERCQVAIRLRLTENLSNSEIAERMNITRKTVENYMFTVMNHLRQDFPRLYKMDN